MGDCSFRSQCPLVAKKEAPYWKEMGVGGAEWEELGMGV